MSQNMYTSTPSTSTATRTVLNLPHHDQIKLTGIENIHEWTTAMREVARYVGATPLLTDSKARESLPKQPLGEIGNVIEQLLAPNDDLILQDLYLQSARRQPLEKLPVTPDQDQDKDPDKDQDQDQDQDQDKDPAKDQAQKRLFTTPFLKPEAHSALLADARTQALLADARTQKNRQLAQALHEMHQFLLQHMTVPVRTRITTRLRNEQRARDGSCEYVTPQPDRVMALAKEFYLTSDTTYMIMVCRAKIDQHHLDNIRSFPEWWRR